MSMQKNILPPAKPKWPGYGFFHRCKMACSEKIVYECELRKRVHQSSDQIISKLQTTICAGAHDRYTFCFSHIDSFGG